MDNDKHDKQSGRGQNSSLSQNVLQPRSIVTFERGFRSARLNNCWRADVINNSPEMIEFNNGHTIRALLGRLVFSAFAPTPTAFAAIIDGSTVPVQLQNLPFPVVTVTRNGFSLSEGSGTPDNKFVVTKRDGQTEEIAGSTTLVSFQSDLESVSCLLSYQSVDEGDIRIHSLETMFPTSVGAEITHAVNGNTVTLTVNPDVLTGVSLGGVAGEDRGNGVWVVDTSTLPKGVPIPVVTTSPNGINVNVNAGSVVIPRNIEILFNDSLSLKSFDNPRSQVVITNPSSLVGKEIFNQNGNRLTMDTASGLIVSGGLITSISVDGNVFETNQKFLSNTPVVSFTRDSLVLSVNNVHFNRFVGADGTALATVNPASIPNNSVPQGLNTVFFENVNGIRSFGTAVGKPVVPDFKVTHSNGVTKIAPTTSDPSFLIDQLKFFIDGVEDVDGTILLNLPRGKHKIEVVVPNGWSGIFEQPFVHIGGDSHFGEVDFIWFVLFATVGVTVISLLSFRDNEETRK